tara:strand:+ start:86 stop:964 length:879 start_codon:yes stop_codon:yes gene_type:complete
MMLVYIESPEPGVRSFNRIIANLKYYAPSHVEFVTEEKQADVVIVHVNGRFNRAQTQAARAVSRRQKYVVNQYCLRSTMEPHTAVWRELWDHAAMVWSYYNLDGCIREDLGTGVIKNFYRSPLGVDGKLFSPDPDSNPSYIIGMSGGGPMVEGVREAVYASQNVGKQLFHLGPLQFGPNVTAVENVPDADLRHWYSRCTYFGGLRRKEGFEMCCAEALACGVRPIFYDRIHYRQWFDEFALFIPEGTRDEVVSSLETIFTHDPVPVTEDERQAALRKFNWATICREYWSRCL